MGRVGRMLQEVLRPADVAHLAAELLAHVSEALVADILSRRDIGVEDSHEIVALLKPVAEEGLARVLPPPGAGPEVGGGAGDRRCSPLTAACPAMTRVQRGLSNAKSSLARAARLLVCAGLSYAAHAVSPVAFVS